MTWTRDLIAPLLATALLIAPCAPARAGRTFPGHRSPDTAFALAAGPGLVLHGLGNYHAGNRKRAGLLLLSELFGLGLMAVDSRSTNVFDGLSGRSSSSGVGMAGQVLFFGSYLFDVATAHEAAERTNGRILRERDARGPRLMLRPSPRTEGRSVVPSVGWQRRF